jgi:low temperature requirement protein LtrA
MTSPAGTDHAAARPSLLRRTETVTPLELFFDLIFVLAVTECTSLMQDQPRWSGLGRGLMVLAILWWAWVGYAWLTSVVDPDEPMARLVIFVAMAGTLIVTLCVPQVFGRLGVTFAVAYAVVRSAHIVLFVIGSRGDPGLRRSVTGLAMSTAVGVGLLLAAGFAHGAVQVVLWMLAIVFDVGGPFVFGSDGWKLVPRHFAERHGLIVLIALGESIVGVGIGAHGDLHAAEVLAIVAGLALIAGLWWAYFDVVATLAADRLEAAPPGRPRNELARDGWSYLHFPMVAGIVLLALGLRFGLAHLGASLTSVAAVAMCGGTALYFLAHVAFARRAVQTFKRYRFALAAVCAAWIPAAMHVPALATLLVLVAAVWATNGYETFRFRADRAAIRAVHLSGESGPVEA